MNEERANPSNDPKRRLPEGESLEIKRSFEETECHLLPHLQSPPQERNATLRQRALFYGDNRRFDQPRERLRELMQLESDLKLKAGYVLALDRPD